MPVLMEQKSSMLRFSKLSAKMTLIQCSNIHVLYVALRSKVP